MASRYIARVDSRSNVAQQTILGHLILQQNSLLVR